MNTKIKNSLFLLVLVIVFIMIFDFEFNSIKDYPEKPNKVSKTAIWSGGFDGGYWFDFIDYNKKTKEYHFVIFDETSGEIVLNGKFIKKKDCNNLPTDNKILKKINYYANNEIVLDKCTLIKVE